MTIIGLSSAVCVAKTIDRNAEIQFLRDEITCSEETKQRIHELGLQSIAFNQYEGAAQVLKILEDRMWEKAHLLKDRIIKKETDFMNAINFLEIFSMYALQVELWGFADKIKIIDINQHLNLREYSRVSKLVQVLEDLSKMNIKGNKSEKMIIKKHIDRALELVDKIFTQDLSKTNKAGLVKYVYKAEKIIKKFAD